MAWVDAHLHTYMRSVQRLFLSCTGADIFHWCFHSFFFLDNYLLWNSGRGQKKKYWLKSTEVHMNLPWSFGHISQLLFPLNMFFHFLAFEYDIAFFQSNCQSFSFFLCKCDPNTQNPMCTRLSFNSTSLCQKLTTYTKCFSRNRHLQPSATDAQPSALLFFASPDSWCYSCTVYQTFYSFSFFHYDLTHIIII